MPTKKQPVMEESQHPPQMLASCAATFATLSANMAQVTKDQAHIAEKIWGNGKTGMDQQLAENMRAVTAILKALEVSAAAREKEAIILAAERKAAQEKAEQEEKEKLEKKEQEEKEKLEKIEERKSDLKKWWLGVATAIILAVIAIARDITTQTALMRLAQK